MPDGMHYALVSNAGRTNNTTIKWSEALQRYVPTALGGGVVLPDGEGVALLDGGNVFTGEQRIELNDLPIVDAAGMMGDAEFTVVASVRDDAGNLLSGVAAAHIDLSDVGGPAEIWASDSFTVLPANGHFMVEVVTKNSPEDIPRISKVEVPNLQLINMLDPEVAVPALYKSGTPIADSDVANKKYVDDAVAGSGAGASAGAIGRAVKYGRGNGGKWALVCGPGFYRTADVGPFDREGVRFRGRACVFEPDPTRYESLIQFYEIITQFRNADGATFDQDNLEIALTLSRSRIGLFIEHCLIGTPFPEAGGEYGDGRVYTDQPDSGLYSGLDYTLGDAIEWRYDYIFNNGSGRWVQNCYVRTDAQFVDLSGPDLHETRPFTQTGYWNPGGGSEDVYWLRVFSLTAPTAQVGSIADAGLFWYVGRNGGLLGVEYAQLSHIDSGEPSGEELVLDFHSKDIDPDTGVATSLLVPGQTFTPFAGDFDVDNNPLPVIDNRATGIMALQDRIAALEP